ncbi:hypothetical protein GPALN_003321 [Globodera pallida]|nr:hypothetical protein GPALN_003321 [Globodera pallida]
MPLKSSNTSSLSGSSSAAKSLSSSNSLSSSPKSSTFSKSKALPDSPTSRSATTGALDGPGTDDSGLGSAALMAFGVLRHLVANGITRQPRTHFANYVRFLLSQRTPAGQRRIRAQFLDLLSCPHRPQQCAPPTAQCVPLPGYHQTNEFLLCFGMPAEREEQVWHKLWQCACQAIVLLDSCSDGQTQFDVPSHFIETDQNGAIRTINLIKADNNNHIHLRRDDGKELFIRLHRIHSTALLHNPWLQIERLQCELQDQHRGQLAVLELGMAVPSAVPFLFCVFQSAACQLEQEVINREPPPPGVDEGYESAGDVEPSREEEQGAGHVQMAQQFEAPAPALPIPMPQNEVQNAVAAQPVVNERPQRCPAAQVPVAAQPVVNERPQRSLAAQNPAVAQHLGKEWPRRPKEVRRFYAQPIVHKRPIPLNQAIESFFST